jgi:hypothetical protein
MWVGWIKINTDGAINAGNSRGGGGGVARSHISFLGAWSKPLGGVTDPLVAEVLAFRWSDLCKASRVFTHGDGNGQLRGSQPLVSAS